MKTGKKISLIVLGLAALFYLINCENITSPQDEELIDAIKEIVLADSIILLDGFDDGGASTADYDQGLAKAVSDTFPLDFFLVRFGRRITEKPEREITVEISGDTAIAEITTTIHGQFIVHYIDTVNSTVLDSVAKDFTGITKQRIKLYKYENTDNPRRNWKVIAFTPIIGRTEGNDIEILSISADSDGNKVFSIENDNDDSILNYYIDRETFVYFRPYTQLHIEMTVDNPTPFIYKPGEVAVVHYGVKRGILKLRRRLIDPEDDNTFEGWFRMHGHNSHMCRIFFDLIDMATIFDKNAPVNSTFWAIPYRVRR